MTVQVIGKGPTGTLVGDPETDTAYWWNGKRWLGPVPLAATRRRAMLDINAGVMPANYPKSKPRRRARPAHVSNGRGRLAYSEDQERDASGKFGHGSGGGKAADSRPTFDKSITEPVQSIADGKAAYNEAHGLDAPSDRDWSTVMADPQLGAQIASDYDAMQDYNTAAEPAYDALGQEVAQQFDHLTNTMGVTVEFMDHDPYDNVEQLAADLRDNNHLGVLRTDATPPGHPYLTNEQNDQFRAVHDAFGHAAIGRGFDRNGEEAAYQSHAEMFSATALPALASETRGQNSALNYGGYGQRGEFPPQKFDLLPPGDLAIDTARTTRAAGARTAAASADDDNLYAVSGSHHVSMGRSFSKPPLPPRPVEPHTSLGRHAAVDPTPEQAKATKLLARLADLRRSFGTRLLAAAEAAYEAALDRAGVKIVTRARSRVNTTKRRQVAAAVKQHAPLQPLLAVVGITDLELLDHSFDSFRAYAVREMHQYQARVEAAVQRTGLDVTMPRVDIEQTADYIVAGLTAMARARLLAGDKATVAALAPKMVPRQPIKSPTGGFDLPGLPDPDELSRAGARLVQGALDILAGRSAPQFPATPDLMPEVVATIGPDESVETQVASTVELKVVWTWVHGFYGEPKTAFEPHERLGDEGFSTTDPEGDDRLTNDLSWPDTDTFFPGDHDGCTCSWVLAAEA